MDACLECGVNYLDTANYEPKDEAHFEYSWQWAYRDLLFVRDAITIGPNTSGCWAHLWATTVPHRSLVVALHTDNRHRRRRRNGRTGACAPVSFMMRMADASATSGLP